jgi:hypothetical protein
MITSALVKGTFGAQGYLFLWETLVATVPGVKSPHLPGTSTDCGSFGRASWPFSG